MNTCHIPFDALNDVAVETPVQGDFMRLVEQGYTHVPLMRRLPVGRHTPVSLYRLVASWPPACLLESSRRDAGDGRYSIVISDPVQVIDARDGVCYVDGQARAGHPVRVLETELGKRRGIRPPGAPPFVSGAVGFFGYECNRFFEPVAVAAQDDLELPDFRFVVANQTWVFDHVADELILVSAGDDYAKCRAQLDDMQAALAGDHGEAPPASAADEPSLHWQSNFSQAAYTRAIERIRDYIRAGDTFQVNLSQRLSVPMRYRPLEVYQRLTRINPVHFSAYCDFGDFRLISGSPERLVQVQAGHARTRPIAGTRRRGTPVEERRFLQELASSDKERAEHIMLVDLERNDLGRICRPGSVRVERLMEIVKYSHVMHIESLVEGKLLPGTGLFDVLRAMFPGGTITGAPKVRTMEIIAELEPHRRGAYTGSLGYIGDDGDMDMNILIRTIVEKGGMAYVQAGGGIVFDADAHREYQETLHKARAQLEAL